MAKKSPILYSVSKTFVWFALISLMLLASLVGIVWLDYNREWKNWQKQFSELKFEKTKKELTSVDEKIDKTKLQDLTKQHEASALTLKAQQSDLGDLQKQIDHLESLLTKARTHSQDLKQFYDSYKYFFEEYTRHKDKRADDYQRKLGALNGPIEKAKAELESIERQKEEKDTLLKNALTKSKNLEKELEKILGDKRRLEKRLEKLKPSLSEYFLNAPMLDFMAPTLRVQQVVLDGLQDDYHFARVQKVDRCTTCHLGIDQKSFEDAPQPFRTHPKLDLFIGSASPHPIEKFGCTTCHGGNGHSVSFVDAAHTPNSDEEAKIWRKKYRWHELEKWDAKMMPLRTVQANCVKCHQGVVEVPGAERLNKGRKLAESSGCFNCHKVSGYENRWKVGPGLEHVGSKLDKDWIERWLDKPRDFRPSTTMPHIFNLSNTSNPEDQARNDAAITAIATYLLKNSENLTLSSPPVPGDATSGEALVKTVGCLGCHSVPGTQSSHFGPELSSLGSKVKSDWLYTWIKDPKHYSKDTRMPNLRLTDQEAADITAHLLSQRNEVFDSKPLPKADPQVVENLIMATLQSTMRQQEAKAQVAQMDEQARLEFLGKKSIAYQGCYSCHTIRGFENAKLIGTELTNEGHKDIHQLDFGFVDIDHTRQAWFSQKLKEPRIFDQGKVKDYYEKLRMPQFHFSDEEIEALTTFLLSLTDERIPLEMQKRLDLKEAQTEKGRLLVAKHNCNGCHTLDGKNGTLRDSAEDLGAAPPILDGEGAKVQEKWLHDFLKQPTSIRVWLKVHMPTFDFSEEELDTLVGYFDNLAHQEISYRGAEAPSSPPTKIEAGKGLFEKFQCIKCHQVSAASQAMGTSFLAPDLTLTNKRLKSEWVKGWLKDPQALQEGTMMPTFFADGQTPMPDVLDGDVDQQIEAIRDYLYQYETAPQTS